jgi:hypothetical protein
MIPYRHTAVDDVTGTPVSELTVRTGFGDNVCLTITVADPDVPRVHHWLTPVALEALAKVLAQEVANNRVQRPVIPMHP